MKVLILTTSIFMISFEAVASPFSCHEFQSINDDLVRPKPPSCVEYPLTSGDQLAFDMCRSDVEFYTEKIRHYLSCLDDESNDAAAEQKKTVDRFDCFASGSTGC